MSAPLYHNCHRLANAESLQSWGLRGVTQRQRDSTHRACLSAIRSNDESSNQPQVAPLRSPLVVREPVAAKVLDDGERDVLRLLLVPDAGIQDLVQLLYGLLHRSREDT